MAQPLHLDTEQVRALRYRRGLRIEDVVAAMSAAGVTVSPNGLRNVEAGKRVSLRLATAYAKALGMPLTALVRLE